MTYYDRNLAALDEIEDALEAYADARFGPPGPVLARIRQNVMAQAAAVAATAAAERRLVSGQRRPARRFFGRFELPAIQLPRRAFALGFAAALSLGTSAAVLAAPPGSAFYNARVALEAMTLPNQADARLAAHEQHLQVRLAEADAAAARGDVVALDAALAAYRAEVDAAVDDLGVDAGRLAHLEAVLGNHVAVLTSLQAKVPEKAAVEHALDVSQKAIVRIKEKGSKGGGKPADKPERPDRSRDHAPRPN